jgi:hypothetical protein
MTQKAATAKTTNSKGSVTPVTASRMMMQSPLSPHVQVLHLHRQYGNRAVQRMYEGGMLQTKLKIGQLDDKYEREADSVAEWVISMPDPQIRFKST